MPVYTGPKRFVLRLRLLYGGHCIGKYIRMTRVIKTTFTLANFIISLSPWNEYSTNFCPMHLKFIKIFSTKLQIKFMQAALHYLIAAL